MFTTRRHRYWSAILATVAASALLPVPVAAGETMMKLLKVLKDKGSITEVEYQMLLEAAREEAAAVPTAKPAEVVTTAQAQGDGVDGLPTSWCGDEITSDYPNTTTKAQFKVVYAFAADRPNRFGGWRDALQANVAMRNAGILDALEANAGSARASAAQIGAATVIDEHLGDVASLLAQLLLRDGRRAQATQMWIAAGRLYGPADPRGAAALRNARALGSGGPG